MASVLYLEREGVDQCISKIETAIVELQTAAQNIEASMNDLPNYWKGNSADKAQATYADEYRNLLAKTVPEAVENFKQYINQCKDQILEVDRLLSGQ
jgi:uncharacterized protein YukE